MPARRPVGNTQLAWAGFDHQPKSVRLDNDLEDPIRFRGQRTRQGAPWRPGMEQRIRLDPVPLGGHSAGRGAG